jgi:hypothetical protein
LKLDQKMADVRHQLGEPESKKVWEEGYAMNMEAAIRYALPE